MRAMSVRLADVVAALRERGEYDEADYCEIVIPFEICIKHGFGMDEVLEMTMDEVEAWYSIPEKPLKYSGWNFWWGTEAHG